jgi:hypothetical protein
VGLRRFRTDASITVMTARAFNSASGEARQSVRHESLDARDGRGGIGLLPEFSSTPAPEFETDERAGWVKVRLAGSSIGNLSAVTFFFGHMWRNASGRYRDESDDKVISHGIVRRPTEVFVRDLIVHEGLFGHVRPSVDVHNDMMAMDFPDENRSLELMPHAETVNYLGKGPSVLSTPDIPRYADMARHVFEQLGLDGDRFDVYRCRIEYPIMPSSVAIGFDLPEAPQENAERASS